MTGRDLHIVSERVLANYRSNGEAVPSEPGIVPVDTVAEDLGLVIVASEARGYLRLPARKRGEIRLDRRLLIVRRDLLDDDNKEADLREVIAHEIAHFLLHAALLWQRPLPFGRIDDRRLELGRISFSKETSTAIEREAIYLGSLLQVPSNDLRIVTRSAVETYACGDWTRVSADVETAEARAARAYSRSAVALTMSAFGVTRSSSKVVLSYWQALARPPKDWINGARQP